MRIFFILLFSSLGQLLVGQSQSIILSPIGSQEVYEGSRITVYFSTLKHFDEVNFTSSDLPDFGQIINDGNGDGRIIFDPLVSDVGNYNITLKSESDDLLNLSTFRLSVLNIDKEKSQIYYLDPENGNDNALGTSDDPFRTLESFLSLQTTLVTDSTFLFLRSGFHGSPVFAGTRGVPVKVLAQAGHTPRVKKLSFSFTTNWYVSGLDISPQNDNKTDIENLITVFSGSKNIEITNSKIYPIEDASVWTTNDMWYAGSGNGIVSSGTDCLFRNNYLKNTWFSVEMRKPNNNFSYNIINWFGADAIRAIANYQTVAYNQVKNATVYDYDHPTRPQHDDGIQSWTFNNPVKGIRIIGNQIADIADPNLPLPTEIMQGIVDFDGFAEDWIVENNLVITHHAHGIALYGAKNCKVVNNTVIRNPLNYYSPNFKPWIRISPRKENVGSDSSFGNLVRNNIMASYQEDGQEPASADHNIISTIYPSIFKDYLGWDFHLADNSIAIDAGITESAVSIDQELRRRDVNLPDAGCFEKGANLIDHEAPSLPLNVAGVVEQTQITLDWDESTDNTEVANYHITINNNRTITTNENAALIAGLEPGKEYELKITASDYFGNFSDETTAQFVTNAEDLVNIHYIPVHRHDQLIKSNRKLKWVGMEELNVGGYFGASQSSAVLPFQLPCIDNDRKIVSGNLKVYVSDIINNPVGNLDLYSLGLRPKSDVLASDFWSGPRSENTTGKLMVEDYLTNDSENNVNLNLANQEELGAELQTLYDQGACNKFAFFRLNLDSNEGSENAYYSVSSSESESSFKRPLLSFVSNSTSSVHTIEILNGLEIFPNPVIGSSINFKIHDFTTDRGIFEIHNNIGQTVYSKNVKISENSTFLKVDLIFKPGIYFAVLRDREKFTQVKFIKK